MRFYVLRPVGDELYGTRFAFAEILEPHNVGDPEAFGVCPACKRGLGPLAWLAPHRIRLSSPSYPDFLWGAAFALIVSERFLHMYATAGLTGITYTGPAVEVVQIGRKPATEAPPHPRYHVVHYVHGGADLDDRRSGALRRRVSCRHCRRSIDALCQVVLEQDSSAGKDMFEAFGLPGNILVTERFKAAVEENELTNADLIPAEEYGLDWRQPHSRTYHARRRSDSV